MNDLHKAKKDSFTYRVLKVVTQRPGSVYSYARCYLLFLKSYLIRSLFPKTSVQLGKNVRIQSLKSVSAELPNARISIGDNSIIYEYCNIDAYKEGQITIGTSALIGGATIVSRYKISIGDHFLSSWGVYIQDFDPHPIDPKLRKIQVDEMVKKFKPAFDGYTHTVDLTSDDQKKLTEWNFPGSPITIGNNVWVGANVTILKGANIGDGCIIATGAVVTSGDYPNNSIIAGNPAKVIKTIV